MFFYMLAMNVLRGYLLLKVMLELSFVLTVVFAKSTRRCPAIYVK